MRLFSSLAALVAVAVPASAEQLRLSLTNTAPVGGTFLTPIFFGAHDGSFVTFTPGQPASAGLQRLAEDGGPQTLLFDQLRAAGGVGGTAGSGPIAPGQTVTLLLNIDPARQQYLAFASMVIPSNDAFIGNPSPTLIPLFDTAGRFIPREGASAIRVTGGQVWDGGSEVNDELPTTTAFLGQTVPDTGTDENGVIRLHPGFLGSERLGGPRGGVLNDPRFPAGDFSADGYQIATITVSQVPAPPAVVLVGIGLGVTALGRRFRRQA